MHAWTNFNFIRDNWNFVNYFPNNLAKLKVKHKKIQYAFPSLDYLYRQLWILTVYFQYSLFKCYSHLIEIIFNCIQIYEPYKLGS